MLCINICMRLNYFLSATLQCIMFLVQKKFGTASSVIKLMLHCLVPLKAKEITN